MPRALHRTVQRKDGTLVLTDWAGKTVPFSKAQTVQTQVSMSTRGELCGLPTRQLAPGFGFTSRPSYYDSRTAVLQGTAGDLGPKRPGPPPLETHAGGRGTHHPHALRDRWPYV